MNKTSPPDPDGPHTKPPVEQERCVVSGRTLTGDTCTVIAISDGKAGVVLYPHGAAGMGVRINWDGVRALVSTLGAWAR